MAGKFVHIDKKAGPKVEHLTCPKCQGAIALRAKGYTKTLVCQYCQTVLDISKAQADILGVSKSTGIIEPLIPLGTRGKLHGTLWEVIGFMQRRATFPPHLLKLESAHRSVKDYLIGLLDEDLDFSSTAPPAPFVWQEYLLFNPYKGFRWLSENKGHWNYIVTLHDIPKGFAGGRMHYLDVEYKFYEAYEATVLYVSGEFYWQVKTGDKTKISDYLFKPGVLSLEETLDKNPSNTTSVKEPTTTLHMGGLEVTESKATAKEQNKEQIWSLAEYIDSNEIQQAFGLDTLPQSSGVAFNQPIPGKKDFYNIFKASAVGVLCLFLAFTGFGITAKPKVVFNETFQVIRDTEIGFDYVSTPFTIDKRSGVLELYLQAPVSQSWVEVEASLINDTTGETIEIQKGLEYYSGYDEDGSWSEGRKADTMSFSSPEAGQYHVALKITADSNIPVNIKLTEGVSSFDNFLLSLFLVLLPSGLSLLYFFIFEIRREQ